jgi:hypothetical protein
MGEWKTVLSLRVRQSLKDDLQKIAEIFRFTCYEPEGREFASSRAHPIPL